MGKSRRLKTVWMTRPVRRGSSRKIRQRYHVRREFPVIRDGRSERAKAADRRRQADVVLPRTRENYLRWKRNKNRFDLMGYDELVKRVVVERRRHRARRRRQKPFKGQDSFQTLKKRTGLTGVEEHHLVELVKKHVAPGDYDKIDVESLVDSSLSYDENKEILERAVAPSMADMGAYLR